jgi:hypothetical protein
MTGERHSFGGADADFSAAHSMDTYWFAVDRDGHVACFESGEAGAVPVGAGEGEGYDLLRRLVSALTAGAVIFDLGGSTPPGPLGAGGHHRSYARLVFLASLDPVRGEIAAQRAYEVPASGGVAVVLRDDAESTLKTLHDRGACLGCFYYDEERDEDPDSEGLPVYPARFGLYYYGHQCENWAAGPYGREEVPREPLHLDQLPPDLRAAVSQVRFPGLCFAQIPHIQPLEWFECDVWGGEPAYVGSDGKPKSELPPR